MESIVGAKARWQEVLVGQRATLFGKAQVEGLSMVDWNIPRAPTSVLVLVRLAAEHGVPADVCLRDTRLGYLELSSFSQAFRRWNGMGPRAYLKARATS